MGFNPRPYARGDVTLFNNDASSARFNPRPYARGDGDKSLQRLIPGVSIHAPMRGATLRLPYLNKLNTCFNPRLYARGDKYITKYIRKSFEFQSTPLLHQLKFQSTPLCEGRQGHRMNKL